MRPFAGRDRVVRIDTGVWPTVSVDTDPFSCPQRDAFASKQEAGILYDPLQLREHLTGDEVLMHGRDWIVLKAQKTSERTRTGMARAKTPGQATRDMAASNAWLHCYHPP